MTDFATLARLSGTSTLYFGDRVETRFTGPQLQAFADLIRQEEREKCAVLCDAHEVDQWNLYKGFSPYSGSEEGRADSYVQGVSDGAGYCADAIRARTTT